MEKLEEAFTNYISDNGLNFLKSEFVDRRKNSTKDLAYPDENFNSIDHYQKPVKHLIKKNTSSVKDIK